MSIQKKKMLNTKKTSSTKFSKCSPSTVQYSTVQYPTKVPVPVIEEDSEDDFFEAFKNSLQGSSDRDLGERFPEAKDS